jgi:hypothetical protein
MLPASNGWRLLGLDRLLRGLRGRHLSGRQGLIRVILWTQAKCQYLIHMMLDTCELWGLHGGSN